MSNNTSHEDVWVLRTKAEDYPAPPFHAPEIYPEFFGRQSQTDPSNILYAEIRQLFASFGFDQENIGTSKWNPLKGMVQPGNAVVIKPNLVFHHHPLQEGIKSMITHASVLRPLIDYVWKALEGRGSIIIGDVPLQTADWNTIIVQSGLQPMVHFLRNQGVNIQLLDLRLEHAVSNSLGVIIYRTFHNGDPQGYRAVNMGSESMLMPVIEKSKRFTITDYKRGTVAKHHNRDRNEYLIPQTILNADVFINVPKLKTHKKGGVTLSLKNLIGINGDKSWIAHHREGSVEKGGDEFPRIHWFDLLRFRIFVSLKGNRFTSYILSFFLKILRVFSSIERILRPRSKSILMQFSSITEGSWYGNDTLWRVIIDLNRILLYTDKRGGLQQSPQRKYFTLIDGLWAGERNGPMHHIPKKAGVIVAGFHPVSTDVVATHLMGFDYTKIPQLVHCFDPMAFPLTRTSMSEVRVHEVLLGEHMDFMSWRKHPTLAFLPPTSWSGRMEHEWRDASTETKEIPLILENVGGE